MMRKSSHLQVLCDDALLGALGVVLGYVAIASITSTLQPGTQRNSVVIQLPQGRKALGQPN